MGALTLHPMKEIRVIVAGEHRAFVTELLDQVKATGYTIIGNVSGKGHHGVREAHFMFSEQESLEMIMTVVPEEKVEPILAGLAAALRTPLRRDVRHRCGRQPAGIFRQEREQFLTEGSHGPIHDQIMARGEEQRSDCPTLVFTIRTCLECTVSQG